MESFALLVITLIVLLVVNTDLFRLLKSPSLIFCLTFALIFAFAVGVSTFNFGTLSRYKIPLVPYYCLALGIIYYGWKSARKASELAATE
jgi:hypothetical protein